MKYKRLFSLIIISSVIMGCSSTNKLFEAKGSDGRLFKSYKGYFSGIKYIMIHEYRGKAEVAISTFDVKDTGGVPTIEFRKTKLDGHTPAYWIGVTDTTRKISFYNYTIDSLRIDWPIQFEPIDSIERVVFSKSLHALQSIHLTKEIKNAADVIGFVKAKSNRSDID